MSTPTTDLFVTIVSSDRELLCDLSWTLSLFGYHVTATCDLGEESPCHRNGRSGLLLIDTRCGDEASELLASTRKEEFVYRVAIDKVESTERLLLAGADDVIRYPVNTGELLTRVRAGVRRLEFEDRLSKRGRRDMMTGLLNRQALLNQLGSLTNPDGPSPTTCVALGVDFLSFIREQSGDKSVHYLKAALGRALQHELQEGEQGGIWGENVLVAVLRRSKDKALEFVDRVSTEFSASDTLVRNLLSLPTLTAIVADWNPEISAEEQLDRCESTLQQAHSFGGNYIALATDVQQRIADWRSNMDAGVPFEDVVAQELMELFPVVLNGELDQVEFKKRLPSQDLSLPCLPIVDDMGKLTGIQRFSQAVFTSQHPSDRPHTVTFDQPLSELFEAFNTTQSDYLVVVDAERRPIGYLTCEGLASLVLDQMNSARYRSSSTDRGIASLVVPVVPAEPEISQAAMAT